MRCRWRIHVEEDLVTDTTGLTITKVTFTKPPRTEIQTPDLGNLLDWENISIRDIIRGLQLASDFLSQFEEFGFLDDPIPVINTSFNDLLAYADEFAIAVEEIARDPDGSLQTLEARLEEVLGIDDGTDTDAGQDPFDIELIYATEELTGASLGETKSILRIDLILGSEWRESLGVEFDLGGGDNDLLAGAAGLAASAAAEIRIALGIDISETRMRGNPALVFRQNDGDENDEIERLDGESWLGDGFLPGQTIRIKGSAFNDQQYEILGITNDGRILVLKDALAASEGVEGVGVAGLEVTGSRAISLFDDTAITARFNAGAEDVSFRAAVGPLGIFVSEGEVDLGGRIGADSNDPSTDPLNFFRAGLDFDQPSDDGRAPIFASGTSGSSNDPHRRQLAETVVENLSDTFSAQLEGGLDVSLPVFFPSDSIERGSVEYSVGFLLDSENGLATTGAGIEFFKVGEPGAVEFGELFDLSGLLDLGQLSLFDNILLAVDGFDLFLGGIQDVLDGEIFGIELPLIGDSLADGARFIEDLRDDFVEPFRDAVEHAETFVDDQENPDRNIVSKLLFDLLAPTGLLLVTRDADGNALADEDVFTARTANLVTDLDAALEAGQFFLRQVIDLDGTRRNDAGSYFEADGSVVTDGEIDIAQIPSESIQDIAFLEWDFRLGQSLAAVDADIALDFGLPALGLEADGAIGLELGWDLELGFGLDFANGFYFDIGSASELEVEIDVILPDRLTGRLAFLQLDAINAGSGLGATFVVDVVNKSDAGDDKLSFGELGKLKLETGLAAEARALLDLQLKLNDELLADFASVFPTVMADFEFDWGIGSRGDVTLGFLASAGGVGTLTRSDANGSFATDGYMADQIIRVSGTTGGANDGAYKILEVHDDRLVVELGQSQAFVALAGQSDVTILLDLSSLSGSILSDGLRLVEFRNVGLDLGSFISDFIQPVLGEIQKVTGPIQPVIDILTAPLPVLSDLGPPTTILDLARLTGAFDPGLIESIADIITLVNAIPTNVSNLVIPFGDFTIFDRSDPAMMAVDPTDPDADLSGMNERAAGDGRSIDAKLDEQAAADPSKRESTSFVNKLKNTKGFQFPILTNPSEIFGLLTGQEITLFGYDMPPLDFDFSVTAFFPLFGPLGIGLTGSGSAHIDFAFGFDSSGLTRFFDSGFENPALIFDGFYVSDNPEDVTGAGPDLPELVFGAGIGLSAELNLGIARAGVQGALELDLFFDLFDPNRDGKIRVGEILENIENEFLFGTPALAPLAIFDLSGVLTARAFAFLKVNLLFFSIDKEFNITPPITLLDFDVEFKRAPKLATELDDGTLQLNMGDYAEQRLNGDLTDGAEHFRVASTDGGLRVTWVGSNGSGPDFTQVYKGNFTRILAKGGRGDDIIDVSRVDQAGIRFELDGGGGNDRLDAGTLRTDVSAELHGGDGADALIGTGGDDLLFGDAGRDRILGGAGDDVIFADGGRLIESDARIRNIDLQLNGGDSTLAPVISRLDGGSFIDDGFAVGQTLEITDRETGSEGIYRISAIDMEWLALDATGVFAPMAGGPIPTSGMLETGSLEILAVGSEFLSAYQVLAGTDDGDDAVAGGLGDDWIFGAGGSDALIGGAIGASGDSVDQQLALLFDLLRGSATGVIDTSSDASGADILIGDGGRLRLLRDGTLREVADTDRGLAFGDDRLFGSGGEDRLYGGRGDDTLRGGDGNDELFGETGFDRLYGEADADRLFGGRDGDVIEGGDGDDWIEGQQGSDLIRGGAGDDRLFGQAGTDTIFGEAGRDTLDGGSDADVLFGGDGDDQLDGGAGDDIVFGDRGGSDFDDVEAMLSTGLVERLRRDAASFESALDVDAPTGAGEDRITVRAGSDQVDGQAGSDRYTVGTRGAENSARVTVFDSGSNLGADIDSLTINGTARDDQFLLRAATNPDGLAFVASINRGTDVERIDYDDLEVLVVNGLFGDDRFALDDLRASATLNGGGGDDFFQIGQLYRSRRTANDANIALDDQFTTTETTRGFLSNGVSAPTTINGGNDNDEVIIFRNVAALQVNGQDGDDSITVRAFALVNPEDKLQEETQISGGGGADTIRYAVNAPVNIDGGDGLDSVSVIGTEFADEFVITKDGVFGAGLNVNFVNVEYLRVDGAEGDDSFYIQSTNEAILTQVSGGLGSDTFQIADGVERAVTSNDLLGHSGLILHDVESNDPVYQGPEGLGIATNGISANVADADEPGIAISEMSGFTRIAEGGAFDWYTVVLTRRPEQEVRVRALAPNPSPEEMARGERSFRVYSAANNQSDGSGTTLFFDADNWWMPQTVFVQADGAFDDAELEGERFGVIQHRVESEDTRTGLLDTVEAPARDADGTVFTEVLLESPLETGYSLVGRGLEIISAPAGAIAGGLGQSLLIESSETVGNVTRLRLFGAFDPDDLPREGSEFRIRFYDGLQLPNVTVQIDDNDAADVILTEIEELRVFERSANQQGGIEAFAHYEVTLSREPRNGETVFVDLEVTSANGEPDQIRLAQDSGSTTSPGTATLRLTFSADPDAPNAWNVPQIVTVSAIDDDAREGFHRGLIEHRVTTAALTDHDEIELTTDVISLVDALGEPGTAAFVLLESLPVQFQGSVDEATANTISGFPSGAISLSDLQRLLDGQDLSGLVVRLTKGPGAGQVRHVASFEADGVVTLDEPWTTIPDDTSRFSLSQMTVSVDGEMLTPERYVVNGSTVVFLDAEGSVEERTASSVVVTYGTLDRGYEGRIEERLSIRVVDNDTAGVLVLESDGSTDVTEVNPNIDGRTAIADRYQIVLSRPPGLRDPLSRDPSFDPSNGPAFVEVIIEPGATLTSRGDLVRGERLVPDGPLVGEPQVEVRASQAQAPGSRIDAEGRLVLVFTAANWNIPQTVEVVARTDELVDGGDTKVFASRPSTLIDIQGPLLIDGAGGSGSLEALTPAVLLPNADPALRETNVKTPTGDVLEATATSLTVDTASLAAYLVERGLSNAQGLVGRTIEIVRGPGLDQFREILAVTTLGDATRIDVAPDWNLEAAELLEVSAYKITNQSLNFFVDESEQNDLVFVHDEDSPADSRGRLTELDYAVFPEMISFFNGKLESGDPGFITPDRLVGFGMGPDTDIARGLRPGGITYSNFEGFELDLGYGHNELTIDSVHERDDAVQTFTRVRTGRGDDTVLIALDLPDNPASGLPWVEVDTGPGNDRSDASASFLGLQIVGGLGNDHLIGGEGDDVIHGDFGSLDFAVLDRAAVRQIVVESLRVGEGGNDVLEGRGGDERLFGGAGHDVVSGEDGSDILFGDYGRVTTSDAVHRTAETTAIFQGGLDILIGGRGNDFLFGGAGGDVLDGDFDHDLIIGEYARLILVNGVATSIVRFAQGDQDLAASAFFDLYSPQFAPVTPFAQATLAPEGARFPDPALRASAAPTSLRRMSSGTDPNPSEEHRVVRGETLWGLAERHLGDPYRWPEIYALNRTRISDPNRLDVGQEIELPREAIGAQPLESSDVELAALQALLDELDARSAAEARAGWGFTNPLAVGSGPPAELEAPSTPEAPPETPSDTQGESERPTDDGAARPAESSGDPDLSSAIWASLLGWRATSTQANVQARGRWRRFDEHTGRFA
jgi:Ca2+-binding RTX toxin-like protein